MLVAFLYIFQYFLDYIHFLWYIGKHYFEYNFLERISEMKTSISNNTSSDKKPIQKHDEILAKVAGVLHISNTFVCPFCGYSERRFGNPEECPYCGRVFDKQNNQHSD